MHYINKQPIVEETQMPNVPPMPVASVVPPILTVPEPYYAISDASSESSFRTKKILLIVLFIIALLALGYGLHLLYKKYKK